MLCKKCVLPESVPDIYLDTEGICNICKDDEGAQESGSSSIVLETEFTKLLKMYKSQSRYDCLVMCSGGKDSTAALYYMKKRYKLNPLAFTFDHGFETAQALENVKNAVEALGVDFLYFKTDYMQEMFSAVLKTGSKAVICHLCSIWYMDLTFETAARYNVPLIIAGWTKGQSKQQPLMSSCGCNAQQAEFSAMAKATREFLSSFVKNNPKYKGFPSSMEEVLTRAKMRQKCLVLSPHWFLPHRADEYVALIKKELKWEFSPLSYPEQTTNCALNFISVYNAMRYFGYTHYHVEMSKLIRLGQLDREEALNKLKINFDKELLNKIAKKLDYVFK